jgi:hypothetical protein
MDCPGTDTHLPFGGTRITAINATQKVRTTRYAYYNRNRRTPVALKAFEASA